MAEVDELLAPYAEREGRGDFPSFLPLPALAPRSELRSYPRSDFQRPAAATAPVEKDIANTLLAPYAAGRSGAEFDVNRRRGHYGSAGINALELAMFLTGRPAFHNLAKAGRPAPLNFSEIAENMRLRGYKPDDIWKASVDYFKTHDPRFVGMFEGERLPSGERPWAVETEPPTLKPSSNATATLAEHYDAPEFFAAHPEAKNYTSVMQEKGSLGDALMPGVGGEWDPKAKTLWNYGPRVAPPDDPMLGAAAIGAHELTHAGSPYSAAAHELRPRALEKTGDTKADWDAMMRWRDQERANERQAYAAHMRSTWSRGDRERIPASTTVREDYTGGDPLDFMRALKWGIPAALAAPVIGTLPFAYLAAREERRANTKKAEDDLARFNPLSYPPPPPSFPESFADDGARHIILENRKR